MILTLTHEEQDLLVEILRNYLSALGMEIAKTDNRQFKAGLKRRQGMVQELVDRLGSG